MAKWGWGTAGKIVKKEHKLISRVVLFFTCMERVDQ